MIVKETGLGEYDVISGGNTYHVSTHCPDEAVVVYACDCLAAECIKNGSLCKHARAVAEFVNRQIDALRFGEEEWRQSEEDNS